MKLGFYLFGILLLGIFFDYIEAKESRWFPPDGVVDVFLLKEYPIRISSFVYYCQETLTYIALACLIFFKPNQFFYLFIVLQALDLVDFWLTGNTAWFYYDKLPVTFNIIMVLSFAIMIYYEFFKFIRASHLA